MAEKSSRAKEDIAWQEYLASIEGKKPKKPAKKGIAIGERLRKLFEKIRPGKKKAKKEPVQKQVAISAKEGKAITLEKKPFEQEPLEKALQKKPEARKVSEKSGLEKPGTEEKKGEKAAIEKYLQKIEPKKEAEQPAAVLKKPAAVFKTSTKKPVKPVAIQKAETAKPVTKKSTPKKAGPKKAAAKKTVQKKLKVSLLPKAQKKENKIFSKRTMPKAKVSKKVAMMPRPGTEKEPGLGKGALEVTAKAGMEMGLSEKEARKLAKIIVEKQALLKKPVEEIEKLPKREIKRVVKEEIKEKRARGWYGDELRHKKAAFTGWRQRKNIKLHKLRKKAKAKKLTEIEKKKWKEMLEKDKELRQKIKQLNSKITALKKLSKEKDRETKIIERKANAVGIKVPKEKQTAKPSIKKRRDMDDFVKAMSRIADELAAATASRQATQMPLEEMFSLEDQIEAKEKLIKNLERAFYKRKINFDQFRERLFDYQSELSEIRLQKEMAEKRLGRLPKEQGKANIKEGAMPGGTRPINVKGGIRLSRQAEKALEKIAEKNLKAGLGEETAKALQKIAADNKERMEERKISERTAFALQKAAESLGSNLGAAKAAAPSAQAVAPVAAQPIQKTQTQARPKMAPSAKPTRAAEPGVIAQPQARPSQVTIEGPRETGSAPSQVQPQAGAATPRPQAPQAYHEPSPRARKAKGKKGKKAKRARSVPQAQVTGGQQPVIIREVVQAPVYPNQGYGREMPQSYGYRERGYEQEPRGYEERPPKGGKRAKGGRPYPRERPVVIEEGKGEKPEERRQSENERRPRGGPVRIIDRIRDRISKPKQEEKKISNEFKQAIEEKAKVGGISKNDIEGLEKKLNSLLNKYNIPENVVRPHIQTLDSTSLLNDFQKLISLIEAKKENATAELIKPAPGFDIKTGVIAKKREKIVGKEKEIKKAKIETSFDKLLHLIQVKGSINLNEAAVQLGMGKKQVKECAEILERNQLIKLVYPPIGPVKLVYPQYLKWKEMEKKKKKKK